MYKPEKKSFKLKWFIPFESKFLIGAISQIREICPFL